MPGDIIIGIIPLQVSDRLRGAFGVICKVQETRGQKKGSGAHRQVQREGGIRKDGTSTWDGLMYTTVNLENPLLKF